MPTQNPIQEQIIAKAMKDEAFRRELLGNPKAVVAREFGITLPDIATIRVVEDTPTTLNIVLPPNLETEGTHELSDAELEEVAGGDYVIFWTTYCQITTKP